MAVGPVKSNLAIVPDALLWTRAEDGPVEWHGSAEKRLEDLLDMAVPRTPRADAEGFLRDYLAGGSQPSKEIEERAKEARGISGPAYAAPPTRSASKSGRRLVSRMVARFWSLPNGSSVIVGKSPNESAPILLTPLHTEVSKLSKFEDQSTCSTVTSREQVVTTTPILDESNEERTELAQLAHDPCLGK